MAESGGERRITHLQDLPEAVLVHVFFLVGDVRSRNAMALTCRKWLLTERTTRTSLSLRGNVRNLFLLPTCFASVTHLDLSFLSPWGHPFLADADHDNHFLIAYRLQQAFPAVTSLTVYARTSSTLQSLASLLPSLRHVSLVRWHPRPLQDPGSDLSLLLSASLNLESLDLSRFYCWAEDVPIALANYPAVAAAITHLNLLSSSMYEGFRCSELLTIATACPNLRHLLIPCIFNPRYLDFVDDDALSALAASCPSLSILHLIDPSTLSPARPIPSLEDPSTSHNHSRITRAGLENLFSALPHIVDFALDLCHKVLDSGPALEALSRRSRVRSLKLGKLQGICKAAGLHLDGVAICGGLRDLCIKNSEDLTDSSLSAIARGCQQLSRFEIYGCKKVTEAGIKKFSGMLRSTLKEVMISSCQNLNAACSLRALEPIRDRIERLHIDCIWGKPGDKLPLPLPQLLPESDDSDVDESNYEGNSSTKKKCKYSYQTNSNKNGGNTFWCKTWDRLRRLSVWIPAGELLSPLPGAGLEDCPELEEINIKVEGDCRTCPRPSQPVFGLSTLALYPQLSKMKLDCGEAIGYALTAPTGHLDLSLWERFYLHGVGDLNLYELDYWPPQDREVNQRSISLPASGLIQGCLSLRKLFIHGTAHEHFMRFFLGMPNLRDVQLREDYYPAPDTDTSTEMRADSCSRFEDALNSRVIPD